MVLLLGRCSESVWSERGNLISSMYLFTCGLFVRFEFLLKNRVEPALKRTMVKTEFASSSSKGSMLIVKVLK